MAQTLPPNNTSHPCTQQTISTGRTPQLHILPKLTPDSNSSGILIRSQNITTGTLPDKSSAVPILKLPVNPQTTPAVQNTEHLLCNNHVNRYQNDLLSLQPEESLLDNSTFDISLPEAEVLPSQSPMDISMLNDLTSVVNDPMNSVISNDVLRGTQQETSVAISNFNQGELEDNLFLFG